MVLPAFNALAGFDPIRTQQTGRLADFGKQLNRFSQGFQAVDVANPYDPSGLLADQGQAALDASNRYVSGVGGQGGTLGIANKYVDFGGYGQQDQGQAGSQMGLQGAAAGQTGYAALDAHNAEINAAASQYGVPANLLKAMINQESSGNWDRDNRVYGGFRNDQILPFVGIFRKTAEAWGLDFDQMIGNKQAQIAGMAKILNGLASQYGGYENAAKVYFGGPGALSGGFTDELGMDSNTYGSKVVNLWKQFDQQGGYSGGYDVRSYGDGGMGSGIVEKALQYVGVPYVWGSLPSPGQDPWQTGWDCSAFVNWLDDSFGSNELPAGSHYQYQDTLNKGLLVRDPNQLRAGDLVFFDTGNTAGGGANLNRAGHVGMYIGNGQFVQAANPGAGTIVSNLSDYMGMYSFLGGRRMSWSGGAGSPGAGYGTGSGRQPFSQRMLQFLMAA